MSTTRESTHRANSHRPAFMSEGSRAKFKRQERIHVLENPIRTRNPKLGRAFEGAVWDVLRKENRGQIHVRFGVWQDESEVTRFVCKVEYPGSMGPDGEVAPWRWWSPLLRTPQELRGELRKALHALHHRSVPVASAAGGRIA